MIRRRPAAALEASSKSLLLLGPRQTGKSTLMAGLDHTPLVFYLGDVARKVEGIDVVPWQEGFRRIGL
jgi:predicted AAA+ superfamily ATPase